MTANLPCVHVAGLPIGALDRRQWTELMLEDCARPRRRPRLLSSANGHVVSRYHSEPHFRELMDRMDAIDADGMPLVLASRLLHATPLPERVSTTDFFHDAAIAAENAGLSFFLLGGTSAENERALARTRERYPRLAIDGRHGYFLSDDEPNLLDEITEFRPHVLWIGLGVPKEQEFAIRHADRLKGIAWIKTCGGLINFLSGQNRRAPTWMQQIGLEWVFRMSLEPRRLGRRYLVTSPHAIYLTLREELRSRANARSRSSP